MILSELQTAILELFKNKLSKPSRIKRLSYPLISRISNEYLQNRVVVVGQETNTWYPKTEDDFHKEFLGSSLKEIERKALIERYDKFVDEEVEEYGGHFWEFNRQLYKRNIINGWIVTKERRLNHCWINLFVMEACKDKEDDSGRPSKRENSTLRNEIISLQKDIVFQLLKLLSPKLVIFLTGHNLDYFLFNFTINDSDPKLIKLHNKLDTKEACQILSKNPYWKDTVMIRLYHPTYFMGRINANKKIKDRIGLHYKVSDFYTEVVFEFLSKNYSF